MDNTNFYFNFSVSTNVYDRNNDNAAKINWTETSGTIEILAKKITEGFAYCNCFLHKGKNFTNTDKKDDNLKGANLVCLDLDAVKYNYTDFCTLMGQTEITPNIVYTTANNGKYKPNKREQYNNRYRVIYVVDEPILNKELYTQIQQSIKSEISLLTEDNCIFNDNTDKAVSHFFAGCKNCSITTDKQPYNLAWLMDRYTINTPNIESATRYNNKDEGKSITQSNNKGINPPQTCSLRPNNQRNSYTYIQDFFNKVNGLESATRYNNREREKGIIKPSDTFSEQEKQFIQDYYYLPFSELIHKYIHQYPSIECTPLEYDDTEQIITLPSDYTEIRRRWYKEEVTKDNGQTVNLSRVHLTNDGEGRRVLLYKNLLLRKRINPTITFCHLLLNAVYEVHYFINNTVDKITKQQIAQIAVNAYFSEDKIKHTTEKRKYKINEKYCAANGISKRAQSIKVINTKKSEEKKAKMEQIKALYNPNLTDKENLNILCEKGVIIALRTYKRYKKELGLIKPSKGDKNGSLIHSDNSTNLSPQSTPNNKMEETPTNTNKTPREENKGANLADLEQTLKGLKSEKDIISFDFNPHYETLKKYDIIKAVVNAEGDKIAEKALNLKQTNYTAFILFVQSKLKAKCSEKDVLIKLL